MKKKFNYRILSLFAFITFCWGLGWPASKLGLDYASATWYTTLRLIVGTLTMFIVVIGAKQFTVPKKRDYPLIVIIGTLQISVYILLANIGLSYLPPGRSALLGYTTPLFVMPVATLFFDEKSTPIRWIGFVLGLLGLMLLMSPWDLDWSDKNVLFGSSMLLLASLSWGVSMLSARYMHWSKSPLQFVPWQLLVGTVPILLIALIKEPAIAINFTPALWLSLAYTGILVTGLSYWSGIVINRELPATIASVGFLAVPVFSLILSAIFFQETINLPTGIAMSMILLGLVCVCI